MVDVHDPAGGPRSGRAIGEIVVSPSGPGAIEAGLMIDGTGTRFVVLTFKEPDADPVIVTFEVALFDRFAAHVATLRDASRDERNWHAG